MTISINKINNTQIYFKSTNSDKKQNAQEKVSTATKVAAAAGSVAGVTSALALIARGHGIKIPSSIKTNPSEVVNILKKLELKEKDVIGMATSSIAGGFIGGTITDRKNSKAKAKEGVVQLLGNYIIPTLFVGGGIKLNKALNHKFNFPPITKPIQFAFGMASLIAGVIAGNRVSRQINRTAFNEEDYRKLNSTDWTQQFDNVCLVTSIATTGTNLAKMASKVIPLAHFIPGYCVGVKKSDN